MRRPNLTKFASSACNKLSQDTFAIVFAFCAAFVTFSIFLLKATSGYAPGDCPKSEPYPISSDNPNSGCPAAVSTSVSALTDPKPYIPFMAFSGYFLYFMLRTFLRQCTGKKRPLSLEEALPVATLEAQRGWNRVLSNCKKITNFQKDLPLTQGQCKYSAAAATVLILFSALCGYLLIYIRGTLGVYGVCSIENSYPTRIIDSSPRNITFIEGYCTYQSGHIEFSPAEWFALSIKALIAGSGTGMIVHDIFDNTKFMGLCKGLSARLPSLPSCACVFDKLPTVRGYQRVSRHIQDDSSDESELDEPMIQVPIRLVQQALSSTAQTSYTDGRPRSASQNSGYLPSYSSIVPNGAAISEPPPPPYPGPAPSAPPLEDALTQ